MTEASIGSVTRVISSPLDEAALAPLTPQEDRIWIDSDLSEAEYRRVAELANSRPGIALSIRNGEEELEFLSEFRTLSELDIANLRLKSLDALCRVPAELDSLIVSDTLSRAVSLAPLAHLTQLRLLYVDGHRKDIEVLSELSQLERLTLRSVTLPGLDLLVSLPRLWWLELQLGGTHNLSRLPDLGSLLHLELWRIRGLEDVSALGSLEGLQSLLLQSMGRVTELPSFEGMRALRWVALDSMKGLTDLRALAAAPYVEQLFLIAMGHLQPDDLTCFVGHPSLRAAVWGLGAVWKNRAAQELLPLEHPLSLDDFWADRR